MNCGWKAVQGASKGFHGKVAGVFCRCQQFRSWKEDVVVGVLSSFLKCHCCPRHPGWDLSCHRDHSHWGYIISRERPKFLGPPGDTHKPAIIALLHDIHPVPLPQL